MLLEIVDGSVSVGGVQVLSHFDFCIRGNEKIALVGRNGVGKTTLLRLIAGELTLDRDDKRKGPGLSTSRALSVGMLKQQPFDDPGMTVEEEFLKDCPCTDSSEKERFDYELECDRLFTGFGFAICDKIRKLSSFSGGEQTKIAFISLLLQKPDILLLDEPTNHLDIDSCEWLEQTLKSYPAAVVMVSHDRYFLDQTAQVVYEVSGGKLTRYPGDYTDYRREKERRIASQRKAYRRAGKERERLEGVVERFKHKPAKAKFARAKKKQIERMQPLTDPEKDDAHIFTGDITPAVPGSKMVLQTDRLRLGYPENFLLELTFSIRRGEKIGLIGPNGAGKSTFLKTVAGLIPPLSGKMSVGSSVTMGYFDQQSARISSDKSVLEHFRDLFPVLTEKEARDILGSWLFGGKLAARKVSDLSGGEKTRLVLAELLQSRPNFLILDEPTNHCDLRTRETLESAFRAYTGTILFVSHDRYFINRLASSLLIFKDHEASYYPFGYEHYREQLRKQEGGEGLTAAVKAEDEALIAGMRAVPKAERGRLREPGEDEIYRDWKERLLTDELKSAEEAFAKLDEACRDLEEQLFTSPEYWSSPNADDLPVAGRLKELKVSRDEAWRAWHEACINYADEAGLFD